MSKYIVETFYTCSFKIVHKLDELNEKKLSELESRKDGEVQIIDLKLNNRKTKTAGKKDDFVDSDNRVNIKNTSEISSMLNDKISTKVLEDFLSLNNLNNKDKKKRGYI